MEETELQISLAEQILKEIVVDDVPFNEALRKKFQPRENEPLRKYRSFVAGLVGCELRHHLLFTALLKKIEGLDEDEKRLVALGLADVYYYKRVGYEEMAALVRSTFKSLAASFDVLVFPLIDVPDVCSNGATPQ